MRGLLKAGVLLAPALVEAVSLEEDTIPSAFITLHLPESDETATNQDVVFRFDIHESTDACGYGNVSIDGQNLPEGGSGSFTVDEDRVIDATWNLTCVTWNEVPQEQLLSLNVGSFDGRPVEDVGFTVRFQQVAPVWISDVEGTASMTRIHSISQPKPHCNDDEQLDIDAEVAELDYLRWQVHELKQKIFAKERRIAETFGWPHHNRPPMIKDCDSLRCLAKALFHTVKGAAWPFYGGMDFPGHPGPRHHGKHPGAWAKHHEHPHGAARAHDHSPFDHDHPPFSHGHHGNNNGTGPHPPHFGHPPPFCKCPPAGPSHGPPHGPPDGFYDPPHGPPHGPLPPPDAFSPPSESEPDASGAHGSGLEHHHDSKPEEHEMKWEEQNENAHPELEDMEIKETDLEEPVLLEVELRRDSEDPKGPRHDQHHGPPHDFEGHHHDGPHHPPHMHDGPEGFDFDPLMPPPPGPPPSDHEGNPMPPPPPGPPGHHRRPRGLAFIHIASVIASIILLGIFISVLHQRYVRRTPAFTYRRRRGYSNAPWYKKLCFGPNYQQVEEEEKEAMLRDCDSDCSSVGGDEDVIITRDMSTLRTTVEVVGDVVAVEEGRMMASSHSRQSSHASMLLLQQQQQQRYAPVMPQPVPMPVQMNSIPVPISAEAAAMFPDLHHDDVVEEALPAYQEVNRGDDDDASELASSLLANGYRPGCSGSYTPSESGSQGANDILGDTKN